MEGVGGSGSGACPLLRRTSTKRSFSTMANSSGDDSPLFVPQDDDDDHYHNEHTTHRPRLPPGLALPQRRAPHFVGDGLDFRRPIMSSNGVGASAGARNGTGRAMDIIDLTEDEFIHTGHAVNRGGSPAGFAPAQRLPRFDRNIIDVDSEAEGLEIPHAQTSDRHSHTDQFPLRGNHNPNLHPRYSVLRRPNRVRPEPMDELDFRTADRPLHQRTAPRSITPYPDDLREAIDLTADDDDDVVFMEARTRPGGVNNDRPAMTGGVGTRSIAGIADIMMERTGVNRLRARLDGMLGQVGLQLQRDAYEEIQHNRLRNIGTNNNQQRDDGMPRMAFGAAITMDYATPAFGMGYAGANEPAQSKYEPPPAAAPGFTRNPGEDEVVVCPNCGDELAVGETDEKQEVWVIKKCGHAYCGDCARNHTKASRSSKKGKGKATMPVGAPNFSKCVVDGCKESATGRAFMHVFIGS